MPKLVAIVEDEIPLAQNYCDAFKRQGYAVQHYVDRASAQSAFEQRLPDFVIIDIGLGDEPEGGYELCQFLRAISPQLPIVFLTAHDTDIDIISGLRLGADDYLTKDISLAHLMARVNALFQRVEALTSVSDHDTTIERGPLVINVDRMTLSWNSQPIAATVTEFWMVLALARNPGHLKTRQQLMDAANIFVDDNTVTSHIKRIRKKIAEVDPDAQPIQTEYGMGYRWRSEPT